MAGDKLWEYYMFRRFIIAMLTYLGLFPVEAPSTFYRLLPALHLLLNMGIGYGILSFVRANIKNVVVITRCISVMVSLFVASMKIFCLIVYRKDVVTLLNLLDKYFENLIKNPKLSHLLNGITTFRRLSWIVSSTGFFATAINCIMPLTFIIRDKIHHIKRPVYPLPNFTKLPWASAGTGISYKFEYLSQTMASISMTAASAGIEPIFSLFVFQMIARVRELTYNLIHIDESNDRDNIIRECATQHSLLLKCRDIIQKVFGPIILQMFISNAVVLCVLAFQLSQIKSFTWHVLFFIPYVTAKFAQTYLCAFAGAQLTAEDEEYRDAVYAVNWHGNKRFTTFVLVTLTQKPLNLVACHFSLISLNIFVSVLNTSMSYFFLLQTLQEE